MEQQSPANGSDSSFDQQLTQLWKFVSGCACLSQASFASFTFQMKKKACRSANVMQPFILSRKWTEDRNGESRNKRPLTTKSSSTPIGATQSMTLQETHCARMQFHETIDPIHCRVVPGPCARRSKHWTKVRILTLDTFYMWYQIISKQPHRMFQNNLASNAVQWTSVAANN